MELLSVASRLALEAVGKQKASQKKAVLDGKNRQKGASRKVLHKVASHAIL